MLDLELVRNQVLTALPQRVRWNVHGTPLDFDFSRALGPLAPVHESEVNGAIDPEWQSLYLFGEQHFAEGGGASPLIGIETNTGRIHGLDPERDTSCLFLLNSDLGSFIDTFILFDNALRKGTVPLPSVSSQARQLDKAFPESDWAQLLEYLLNG